MYKIQQTGYVVFEKQALLDSSQLLYLNLSLSAIDVTEMLKVLQARSRERWFSVEPRHQCELTIREEASDGVENLRIISMPRLFGPPIPYLPLQ